jgi:hypothetical protein
MNLQMLLRNWQVLVSYRVKARRLNSRCTTRLLCDPKNPLRWKFSPFDQLCFLLEIVGHNHHVQ